MHFFTLRYKCKKCGGIKKVRDFSESRKFSNALGNDLYLINYVKIVGIVCIDYFSVYFLKKRLQNCIVVFFKILDGRSNILDIGLNLDFCLRRFAKLAKQIVYHLQKLYMLNNLKVVPQRYCIF